MKHCYDELRAYHVSLLCCGESSTYDSWIWKLRCSVGLYLEKCYAGKWLHSCRSLMDKCPLLIVLQTALLFLLWFEHSLLLETHRRRETPKGHSIALQRYATGSCVRDGLCFHRRSSETVRKKVRRPFKKKYFGKHVYQTNVVGRCAVTILLPILDLNFVCVCLLHCTCILVKLCFKM